jgi:hypothetical protein
MKIRMCLLLLLIFSVIFTGCVSLNSHQSGRTSGKDNYCLTGNFNFGKIKSGQYFALEDSGYYYIAEVGGQYGIKENIDLGLIVNTSTHFTVTSKLQIIGDKHSLFATSLGFDLGIGPLALLAGAISYSSSFSIYNSLHLGDKIAITLTPKYTYLGFTNLTKEYAFTTKNNIYGYSTGLILGNKHQILLEWSQYVNDTKFTFQQSPQISLGYRFNFTRAIQGRPKPDFIFN